MKQRRSKDSVDPPPGNGKAMHVDLHAGLCGRCWYASRTGSRRGGTFLLCERSREDPAYPKYPRLPVLSCAGYVPERKTEPE